MIKNKIHGIYNKIFNSLQNKYVSKALTSLAFVSFTILFGLYTASVYAKCGIDSDYSSLVLEANDILNGNIFLDKWYQTGISFITTDLLFYVIGAIFGGVSRTTFLIASVVMWEAISVLALLLIYETSGSKRFFPLVLLLVFGAIQPSAYTPLVTRAHTGAVIWALSALLMLIRFEKQETSMGMFLHGGLIALFVMLGCVGDALAYVIIVLPFVMYLGYGMIMGVSGINIKRNLIGISSVVVGVTCGIIFDRLFYLCGAVKNSIGTKHFVAVDKIIEKFQLWLECVFSMCGADLFGKPVGIDILKYGIYAVFVIFALVLAFYNVIRFFMLKNYDKVSVILGFSTIVVSVIFIFTDLSVDINSARYMGYFPIYFAVIVIRFLYSKGILNFKLFYNKLSVSVALLVIVFVLLLQTISLPLSFDVKDNTGRNGISDFLYENGLTCGYASFWSASTLTVESRERVKVRAVTYNHELISFTPYYWYTKTDWYTETANFVIIDSNGTFFTRDNVLTVFGEPSKIFNYSDFEIFFYDVPISITQVY